MLVQGNSINKTSSAGIQIFSKIAFMRSCYSCVQYIIWVRIKEFEFAVEKSFHCRDSYSVAFETYNFLENIDFCADRINFNL